MSKRPSDGYRQGDTAAHLQPLADDDAFLTELSLGNDPSKGEDGLAALLLELRDDVNRQMPPAPVIEGADEQPALLSLDAERKRRRVSPFFSGLVGAAAATLVIAGGGVAIHNAGPGSPLYGMNQEIFGDDAPDMVELASTLDAIEDSAAKGDLENTRKLLKDARKQLREREALAEDAAARASRAPRTVTETSTPKPVTTTVAPQPERSEPSTVTSVETTTVTETLLVNPTEPTAETPLPSEPVNPTEAPSEPGAGDTPTSGGAQLPPPSAQ